MPVRTGPSKGAAMKKPVNVNWKKVINNLETEFPEVGLDAPDVEMIMNELDDDTVGNLTRITMDIFVFDNDDLEKAYMFQNDDIKVYQGISFEQSKQLIIQSKNKMT